MTKAFPEFRNNPGLGRVWEGPQSPTQNVTHAVSTAAAAQ
jgi:hypothetical protein